MTFTKIPARDIIVQVAESDGTTWTDIGGLNSVQPNPGENEETANSTDFDSQGAYEQYVMQRGATLTLEGQLLKDDTTGALDPGQDRCETLARALALSSRGQIRFRYPVDPTWKVWTATFSLGQQGGDTNVLVAWSCTVTRCGASTEVAV